MDWLSLDYRVFGIDISPTAVDQAKRMHGWISKQIQVVNATQLPFPDNEFDCVVDVCCLQHVDMVGIALNEAYRVLKPSGWIFSVMAAREHSDKAFPAGIYTHKLSSGIEPLAMLGDAGFTEARNYYSTYEDEVHGWIAHWLTHGRKP